MNDPAPSTKSGPAAVSTPQALVPRPLAEDRWSLAFGAACCAVALGQAIQISNGNQHPSAFVLLVAALGLSLLALVLPKWSFAERALPSATLFILGGGLAWQLSQLVIRYPAHYVRASVPEYQLFFGVAAAAGIIGASALGGLRWMPKLRTPLLVLLWAWLGMWILEHSPKPAIDVFAWHVESITAFLDGKNPYALTMPDIYGHSQFYGPGLLQNGRVMVGFPYPPLSLFLATAAHVASGDYRWANLLAIALSAPLIAGAGRTRLAAVAACVLLFTPRAFFVLEQGWTDAYAVFFLALVVFAAVRWPRAMPYALGLLFAIKHYLILSAPLVILLMPGPFRWRALWPIAWKSAAVAAVFTLPMALWDPAAFYRDLVGFQALQPFRMDALTVLSWYPQTTGTTTPPSTAFGFIAFLVVTALALWRAPRTPAGFAFSVAISFLFFFAFSKQAFANYYFFIIGSFCVALGAVTKRLRGAQE